MEKISHDLRSKFSEKVVQYIQKAKQDECTPEIMKHKIDGEHYSKYSKVNIFLCLANVIYTEYEKNKINNHKIDFYDYLSNEFTLAQVLLNSGIDAIDVVFEKFLLKKMREELKSKIREREMVDLYKKISKEISIETSQYQSSSLMPLVHFGKRFIKEDKQSRSAGRIQKYCFLSLQRSQPKMILQCG